MNERKETIVRLYSAWSRVPDPSMTLGRFLRDALRQYDETLEGVEDYFLVEVVECYSRRLNEIATGQRPPDPPQTTAPSRAPRGS